MKTSALLLAPLAAVLAACDSPPEPLGVDQSIEPAVLVSQEPINSAGATQPVMPVKQVSNGVTGYVGWCDEAAGVVLISAPGNGIGSHVGRFEVQQTHCLDPATGVSTEGVATLIAEAGDEIYLAFEGQVVPGLMPPTSDLVYVVTGGTGRFANAEGEIDIRVSFPSLSTWVSSGSGWIRYTASDRSEK